MADLNPMSKLMWQKLIALLLVGFIVLLLAMWMRPKPQTEVYLVRHAEKLTGPDAGSNPDLSEAGKTRAQVLAAKLSQKNIKYIYSTNTKRTLETAKPLADELTLKIEIYDPKKLVALADDIRAHPGGSLVVGHSNTIPETVEALGGDGGTPINEASEYDRLYIVRIDKDGKASSQISHYGARYVPARELERQEGR